MGSDGTILRANRAALDMVGSGRDEYVGRNVREFQVDPDIADDVLQRVRAGATVRNVEARLRHRDGSIRHVLISANARSSSDDTSTTPPATSTISPPARDVGRALRG